ncbi:hypothetical protein [Arthrobacter sp. ISL-72]
MNDALPPCPECSSEYTYEMGALGPMQLKSTVVKKA